MWSTRGMAEKRMFPAAVEAAAVEAAAVEAAAVEAPAESGSLIRVNAEIRQPRCKGVVCTSIWRMVIIHSTIIKRG